MRKTRGTVVGYVAAFKGLDRAIDAGTVSEITRSSISHL